MQKKTKSFDFEKGLSSLEALVAKMESGEMSLEQSLSAFEQGVALSKDCHLALAQAEKRVAELVSDDLSSTTPFEEPEA